MKITGIIAEYNPFHNGHKYHLEETRRITDADYLIAIISGDFMQRGTPAIADKYLRTEAALLNGADLVLELPLFYATGSAEYFAAGAVTLLDKLGAVNSLCFGSECGNIQKLSAVASILAREPEAYQTCLQKELKNGHSFPKARNFALKSCLPVSDYDDTFFSSPNNILGIEYIKTLLKRDSTIIPYTIIRKGNNYHDHALQGSGNSMAELLSSASAIRSILTSSTSSSPACRLTDSNSLSNVRAHIPNSVYCLLESALCRSFPICSDDFSSLLHYKLLLEAPDGFLRYLDVNNSLSDKICRNLFQFTGYGQFCGLLKSKDLTYTRLSRSLLHILLNITHEQMAEYVQNDYIAYARILGFCKTAAPLLKELKAHTAIPIISKLADARHQLTPIGLAMLEQDIQAAHIYGSVTTAKYHTPSTNEYTRQLIILG